MTILNMILPNIEWWWGGWQPWANTIAYYKFDQNLNDSSGNGNNATMVWTLSYAQLIWNEYYAYGDNACVNTPLTQAQVYNHAFTLCAWFKMNSSSTLQRLFRDDRAWWVDIQYEFYNNFSGLEFYMDYKSSNKRIAFPMANPWVWVWKHIVFTWDGVNQVKAYIDWVNIQPYSNYNPTFDYNAPSNKIFVILNHSSTVSQNNMSVDEVILEDRERTAQEILDYYNQIKANYWIQSLSNTLTITPNITPTITPNTPNNWSGSVLTI
jgi:hypothetical protein